MAELNFIASSEGREFKLHGDIPQIGSTINIRSNRDVNGNFTLTQNDFLAGVSPEFREIFNRYKIMDVITDYEEIGIQGECTRCKLILRAYIYIKSLREISEEELYKNGTVITL